MRFPALAVCTLLVLGGCTERPSEPIALQRAHPITANAFSYCGESQCQPLDGVYISHYTGGNCDGQEMYYTGYYNFDGLRRSHDGQGIAGTLLRRQTARSYRMSGVCVANAWGTTGNTLDDLVFIYRWSGPEPWYCGEDNCIALRPDVSTSHYSGPNCTGTEMYHAASSGVYKSWNAQGISGAVVTTRNVMSYLESTGRCNNRWPSGYDMPGLSIIYRDPNVYVPPPTSYVQTYCSETWCDPVNRTYNSHYSGINCTGTEYFYKPYGDMIYLGTWNGQGWVGRTTQTATVRSYRPAGSGQCRNEWVNGNDLANVGQVSRDPSVYVPPPTSYYTPPTSPCGEATCYAVSSVYISHFSEPNCTGQEYYYTGYTGPTSSKRQSWDGRGYGGAILRYANTRSYKYGNSCNPNPWPNGNWLNNLVYIYR